MSRFRRRLMGLSALRQALKDDYVRVEYIENVSNAYIDTEIIQRSRNYEAVLRFQWVGSNAQLFETFYGYMFSTAKVEPRSGFHKYQGKWMFGTNNTTISLANVDNNIHTVRLSSNATTQNEILYIDGVEVSRALTNINGIADNHLSFYLFCRNLGGVVNNSALCRIYSFDYKQFSDGAHSSVYAHWNFVPVLNRKNNKYGMFDLVGQKFYTSPNGAKFVGGREIIYDAEIEYLESNGTQLIDTLYVPKGYDNIIETKITHLGYSNTNSWIPWFSTYVNEETNTYRIIRNDNHNTKIFVYNGNKASGGGMNVDVTIGSDYDFKIYPSYFLVNGTRYNFTTLRGNENTNTLRLFNGGGTKIRMWGFKLTKGSTVVLDMIPVRVGNVGYMYDKVSGKLFGNNGSGSFILGQDTVVYDKI